MKRKKKLLIVAGAAAEIGTAFCKKTVENKIDCIGIIRRNKVDLESPFFRQTICHLDDEKSIKKSFAKIDLKQYEEIILLHSIGTDRFEPRGYPNISRLETIPSEVYNTNVNSFKYLLRYLVSKIGNINKVESEKVRLKLAMIGGVPDKHAIFVIESFCEAKFIARQYIQSCVTLHPDWISGLCVNITSTITSSALKLRPHADTKDWLLPEEVANQSFKKLLSKSSKYKEIDIIKYSAEFVSGYYDSNEALYEKWSRETGIK